MNIHDLIGKKIAVHSPTKDGYATLLSALKEMGMTEDKVSLMALGWNSYGRNLCIEIAGNIDESGYADLAFYLEMGYEIVGLSELLPKTATTTPAYSPSDQDFIDRAAIVAMQGFLSSGKYDNGAHSYSALAEYSYDISLAMLDQRNKIFNQTSK